MIRRETMIKALKNDAIDNPDSWDEGFYTKIDLMPNSELLGNYLCIGYVWEESYVDNSMDLNRAFA